MTSGPSRSTADAEPEPLAQATGVSVVIPVRNGARCLTDTLASVWAEIENIGIPAELIVVDDGSTDGSLKLVKTLAGSRAVTTIHGEGRGAAAAINLGLRQARYPIVCQVDQDVVLRSGWMSHLVQALDHSGVAAAQGQYVTDPRATWLPRLMGRDLEMRYLSVPYETDHVCTGNVAYRAAALWQVGLFDESLGYGYDNDISYRLRAAGYRLVFCREAQSMHRWREGTTGYIGQQYGFGYGRLDVVAKHPTRVGGDAVSPALMMLHPIVLVLSLMCFAAAFVLPSDLAPTARVLGVCLLAGLTLERTMVGIRAARRFRDLTPLAFPVVHLVRDLAWVSAVLVWTLRRIAGTHAAPWQSMRPRLAGSDPAFRGLLPSQPACAALLERTLVVIPACNEGSNLPSVVGEIRTCHEAIEILVVDDGSADGTEAVVKTLGVRWLRLPERMGIGVAVRAGLRYAARQQFTSVVRLDGDGQHRAEDIVRLLEPLLHGRADVTLGCRVAPAQSVWLKRPLAACLTVLTRRRVTDPTCGFYAVGPRALQLLSEHHPTGYPEPELRLLLSRTTLTTKDVPVGCRARMNGRTSLTPARIVAAAARVLLAMCVVPLRPIRFVRGTGD